MSQFMQGEIGGNAEMGGAVRGFWMVDGPQVVLSGLEEVTTSELEDAVVAAVNEVMDLAEVSN